MNTECKIYRWIFAVGIILPIVMVPAYVFMVHMGVSLSGITGGCRLYTACGLYCTGCGGTRAVRELLSGHIISSFRYHPIVLYAAYLYLYFMVSFICERVSRGKIKVIRFSPMHGYIAIAIIVVQCVVKNMMVLVWGIHII
jgi:hypothetical protein